MNNIKWILSGRTKPADPTTYLLEYGKIRISLKSTNVRQNLGSFDIEGRMIFKCRMAGR